MDFTFGFEYNDIKFGFKDKKLFRLPYSKDGRQYWLHEIKPHLCNGTICYNICRKKMTKKRVLGMVVKVKWIVNHFTDKNLPF